jgi:hypothetical protein
MALHLVIEAADVSKRGLRDGTAHRQGVAPLPSWIDGWRSLKAAARGR